MYTTTDASWRAFFTRGHVAFGEAMTVTSDVYWRAIRAASPACARKRSVMPGPTGPTTMTTFAGRAAAETTGTEIPATRNAAKRQASRRFTTGRHNPCSMA